MVLISRSYVIGKSTEDVVISATCQSPTDAVIDALKWTLMCVGVLSRNVFLAVSDRSSEGGNAVASVRQSVRLYLRID